jgi:predicted transcriptional regulator
MKDELDALAKSTGRNRNALVQEALRRFIDVQRWQIAEIEAGIREADAGIVVGDDEMDALWAEFGLEPDTARERGG